MGMVGVRLLRCRAALAALLATLVLGTATVGARAQGTDDLAALRAQAHQLRDQGNSADALPIAERYVASARQKYGEEHTEFATAIDALASVYNALGRYAEAEPLLKRALAITEKALGPDHPEVSPMLSNLAGLYRAVGRYAEAERLYKRSLDI